MFQISPDFFSGNFRFPVGPPFLILKIGNERCMGQYTDMMLMNPVPYFFAIPFGFFLLVFTETFQRK